MQPDDLLYYTTGITDGKENEEIKGKEGNGVLVHLQLRYYWVYINTKEVGIATKHG